MKSERPHKKLLAWQKGMELVEVVHKATETFPAKEEFGSTSQMRRAAVSVPSNIAEGAAGRTKDVFLQFLSVASGSLSALDTQVEIAVRVAYLAQTQAERAQSLINETAALINGLRRSLRKPSITP
jgi:four helix bundle protein